MRLKVPFSNCPNNFSHSISNRSRKNMKKFFFDKGSAMHRTLAILEQVANSDQPVTSTEINVNLNLPKATIQRLCSKLEDE